MLITFATVTNPTEAEIVAVIEGIIGAGRPMSYAYNADLGVLFFVDLPDATQLEADDVEAALIAAFPAQTAGLALEPHALLSMLDGSPHTWLTMPSGVTELMGSTAFRAGCSMRKIEQVRLVVNVISAGVAGSNFRAQWSTGGAFAYFDTAISGPQVPLTPVGFRVSDWITVPQAARSDGVAIRIVGQGGNGLASPQFGQVLVEGR